MVSGKQKREEDDFWGNICKLKTLHIPADAEHIIRGGGERCPDLRAAAVRGRARCPLRSGAFSLLVWRLGDRLQVRTSFPAPQLAACATKTFPRSVIQGRGAREAHVRLQSCSLLPSLELFISSSPKWLLCPVNWQARCPACIRDDGLAAHPACPARLDASERLGSSVPEANSWPSAPEPGLYLNTWQRAFGTGEADANLGASGDPSGHTARLPPVR